jgi:hypothetical protein
VGGQEVPDGGASRVGDSWESFNGGRVSVFVQLRTIKG